jgi:hypothetical protein
MHSATARRCPQDVRRHGSILRARSPCRLWLAQLPALARTRARLFDRAPTEDTILRFSTRAAKLASELADRLSDQLPEPTSSDAQSGSPSPEKSPICQNIDFAPARRADGSAPRPRSTVLAPTSSASGGLLHEDAPGRGSTSAACCPAPDQQGFCASSATGPSKRTEVERGRGLSSVRPCQRAQTQ